MVPVIVLTGWFIRLITEVRTGGVFVRLWPFPFSHIKLDGATSIRSVTYRPIRDYGGWGYRIKLGTGKRAWNARGDRGVLIEYDDGKSMLDRQPVARPPPARNRNRGQAERIAAMREHATAPSRSRARRGAGVPPVNAPADADTTPLAHDRHGCGTGVPPVAFRHCPTGAPKSNPTALCPPRTHPGEASAQ